MATIHYDFSETKEYKKPLSNVNAKFEAYIDKYVELGEGADFDDLLSDESDTTILLNLSNLRSSILNWYDFREGASILEIGASFGAVTDILVRKGLDVSVTEKSVFRAQMLEKRFNGSDINIYVGDVRDMTFTNKFDYIFLNGLIEKIGNGSSNESLYSGYLTFLKSLLREGGVLLVTADNKTGLKYLAGSPDPYVNKAFSGLNNYPEGTKGRLFTQHELKNIITTAGFAKNRFYYPLPDYKFAQLIYSDEHLPEENLRERLLPYYFRKDTLVFDENSLYADLVKNGGFPFAANSFLIECGNEDSGFSDIEYAAMSTDRGMDKCYATAIHRKNTTLCGEQERYVTKSPIYETGRDNARNLQGNTEDLLAHNIPVLRHTISENAELSMDYVQLPTLSNYIKRIIATDTNKVYEILNRIWNYILWSSEEIGSATTQPENWPGALKLTIDMTGCEGPILKNAYMELIPLNCFYNEGTDEYLFFDQEYVIENCPAKYVLFRAIHYIFVFTDNIGNYIRLEDVKERYGLTRDWDTYLRAENEFLETVRNKKKYTWFYKFIGSDRNRILENANKLASETEKKHDYVISDKMKKTWKVELQMLDEIDRICKKHNITYYMVHGTLLGAVRHKGFIPWDDDLDVAMKRSDYDRFIEVAGEELRLPLKLKLPTDESDIWWGPFARIMNVDTTAILPHNLDKKGEQGIWIDILPIDVCTADEELLNRKLKKLEHLHKLMQAKVNGKDTKSIAGMKYIPSLWYKILAMSKSQKSIATRLDTTMRLYTDTPSKDVAIFTGYSKLKIFNAVDFEGTVDLEFEGRKLPAPIGYENYLFRSLGGDYMKFPPEEERKPKHRGIFDPFKSYTEYTDLLSGTFEGAKGKQIILFGSGLMFEDYMKKYGDKYRPSFIVDNDENKWERRRMGLEIKAPSSILEVPEKKRFVIICSYYYKEIIPQLEQMGVTEYKVYVQEMEWILKSEEQYAEKMS